MAAPFEAVLFDFAGVLTRSPFDAVRAWGSRAGVDPETALRAAFGDYDDDTDHPWQRAERGELPLAEAMVLIAEESARVGLEVDPGGLAAFFAPSTVQEDVLSRLRGARQAGLRTGLVTNTVVELAPYWKPLIPLDELFDTIVESCEVGLRKPNPAIFALALARLDTPAARTIFVDDWPGHVEAARRLGMAGVVMGGDRRQALDELDGLLNLHR